MSVLKEANDTIADLENEIDSLQLNSIGLEKELERKGPAMIKLAEENMGLRVEVERLKKGSPYCSCGCHAPVDQQVANLRAEVERQRKSHAGIVADLVAEVERLKLELHGFQTAPLHMAIPVLKERAEKAEAESKADQEITFAIEEERDRALARVAHLEKSANVAFVQECETFTNSMREVLQQLADIGWPNLAAKITHEHFTRIKEVLEEK